VEALPLGSKRPRYAVEGAAGNDWVVGYRFAEHAGARSVLYAPCFGCWSEALAVAAEASAGIVVDGTFWSDEELAWTNRSPHRARQMGHLPISGQEGSLERIRSLPADRRIYTHLNNTNPVLDPASPQRAQVARAGIEVAADGLELDL